MLCETRPMTAPGLVEDAPLVVAWALAGERTGAPEAADLLRAVVAEVCAVDAGTVTVARICPRCGGSTPAALS